MSEITVCNICECHGKYETALEVTEIYSNVRKFKNEKFTVWRCSNCNSLHSKEAVNLDYYYEHYPIKQHTMNYATRCAYRNRLRLLRKHGLKKEHTILDFGCGQGVFVLFLQQCGYKAFGYDPYVEKYADKKILDNTFDVVTSYETIEHVNQPSEFFGQVVCCLRQGGLMVIGTPNADKIDLSNPKKFAMELHQPYHRHILSEGALLSLGLKAGLNLIRVYHRFYFDTLCPMVNTRLLKAYVRCAGNFCDAMFEKPHYRYLLTSPQLLFYIFAGYFFPPQGQITVFFRKTPN
ncbi:MAG: class I SAM-dependent methyltransferase [Planctomycetes bacterium]|nr:class I SAM-dependent methyltransferase [Planctomycetota bacterium]